MCFYVLFFFFKGRLLVPLVLLSCWTLVFTCYFICTACTCLCSQINDDDDDDYECWWMTLQTGKNDISRRVPSNTAPRFNWSRRRRQRYSQVYTRYDLFSIELKGFLYDIKWTMNILSQCLGVYVFIPDVYGTKNPRRKLTTVNGIDLWRPFLEL